MKTTIYYFSGTGNSLDCAKELAQKLGDTDIVSIPSLRDQEEIIPDTESVGIVFPVYGWAPPRTVIEFAKKLKLTENYVFAVATCGGTQGKSLQVLNKNLNKNLNAGFAVKEEGHSPLKDEILLVRFMMKINNKRAQLRKDRIQDIVSAIKNKQTVPIEKSSFLVNILGSVLKKPASIQFRATDKDFWVDENCNSCGTCVRVCPRNNITKKNNKPFWNHDCESCFGCIQWCPKSSIHYKKNIENVRTHNPRITIKEMIIK